MNDSIQKIPKFITSWDDYSPLNYRLADLLIKYRIPAIFFIELGNPQEFPNAWPHQKENEAQIKNLYSRGFWIGGHTYIHPPDIKILSDFHLEKEIIWNKKQLENIINEKIEWFAYPRGRFDARIKKYVRNAGYKFARTTRILNKGYIDDFYEIDTTIHCRQRQEYQNWDWLELAKVRISELKMKPDELPYIHIWGHSWEIEKYNEWNKLEELFKYINENLFC